MPVINIAELTNLGVTSAAKEKIIDLLKKNSGSSFDEIIRKVMTPKKVRPRTFRKAVSGQITVKNVRNTGTSNSVANSKTLRTSTNALTATQKTTKSVVIMKVKAASELRSGQMITEPTTMIAKSDKSTDSTVRVNFTTKPSIKKRVITTDQPGKVENSLLAPLTSVTNDEMSTMMTDQTGRNVIRKELESSESENLSAIALTGQENVLRPLISNNETESSDRQIIDVASENIKARANVSQTGEISRNIPTEKTTTLLGKNHHANPVGNQDLSQSLGVVRVKNAVSQTESASSKILNATSDIKTPVSGRITELPAEPRLEMNGQTITDLGIFSGLQKSNPSSGRDINLNKVINMEINPVAQIKPVGDSKSAVNSVNTLKSARLEMSQPALEVETVKPVMDSAKSAVQSKTVSLADDKPMQSDFSRSVKNTISPDVTLKTSDEPAVKPALVVSSVAEKQETVIRPQDVGTAKRTVIHPAKQGDFKAPDSKPTQTIPLADLSMSTKSKQIAEAMTPEVSSAPKKAVETQLSENLKPAQNLVKQAGDPETSSLNSSDFSQEQPKDKSETKGSNVSEKTVFNRQTTATQFGLKTTPTTHENIEQTRSVPRPIGNQFVQQLGDQINLAVTSTPRMTKIALESETVGKIEVQFSRDPEENKATIIVESEEVSNQIQKVMPSIVENLNQKGIQFAALDVQVRDFSDNRKREKESVPLAETTGRNDSIPESKISTDKQSIRSYGYNTIEYVA